MVAAASSPDVRAQAVVAATKLFAAQGFDATSVQQVADAVGVTKQAVLHHFSSKEHLRTAVLDAILAHWNEALPRLLLAATASEDRFQAVFGELRRFFAEDPDRALVVLREGLDRPAEMKKLFRGPVKPWLSAVASYIESGRNAGAHWADVDAEAYVVHVLLLVIATSAAAPVATAVVDRERYDRELVRIARASLFVPESSSPRASAPKKKTKKPTR